MKTQKGRNLTNVEAILVIAKTTHMTVAQTAEQIEVYIKSQAEKSETRTLSEGEVMDILNEQKVCVRVKIGMTDLATSLFRNELAKQICSLAIPEQPTMSEEQIVRLMKAVIKMHSNLAMDIPEQKELYLAYHECKAALSQTQKK